MQGCQGVRFIKSCLFNGVKESEVDDLGSAYFAFRFRSGSGLLPHVVDYSEISGFSAESEICIFCVFQAQNLTLRFPH